MPNRNQRVRTRPELAVDDRVRVQVIGITWARHRPGELLNRVSGHCLARACVKGPKVGSLGSNINPGTHAVSLQSVNSSDRLQSAVLAATHSQQIV